MREARRGERARRIGPAAEPRHGIAEGEAFRLHHEGDDVPAGLACAHAMPKALRRGHDEGRGFVVVERAAADEVGAVGFEVDALGVEEGGEIGVRLEAKEFSGWDARHGGISCRGGRRCGA